MLYGDQGASIYWEGGVLAGGVDFIFGAMTIAVDGATIVANINGEKGDKCYISAGRSGSDEKGLQVTGDHFTNPAAATNMTMIAKVEGVQVTGDRLRVFVNDELAAVTSPLDSLYFLTIQSDKTGELKFEIDGKTYVPESGVVNYSADAHYGTLKAPIILRPADETGVYKIIENNHVVIIRNNEKYDVTGKKLK